MEEEMHDTICWVQLLSLDPELPCLSQAENPLCSPSYIAACSWASSLVPLSHYAIRQECLWLPWCLPVAGQSTNLLYVFNLNVSSLTHPWRLAPTQIRWHLIPWKIVAELDDQSPPSLDCIHCCLVLTYVAFSFVSFAVSLSKSSSISRLEVS